uniref:LOW QUALITY PROTEIN: putative phospholipase B-like 2 n=1 Tax=Ciona intestinalis TaxID=7719 RepID=UPI000EF46B31|nr:LOW QUALITY PROTEIN: putative phospholipase B-like 2 [Ciona intestinalis]|eukprot:XP_002119470.4 LOW QUALITY PROTEIN: putative phospholipase B-like 2 [Ciona intestinalis]
MPIVTGELIPGHTSSFSSNPGSIFSGDDFYILSSGLTTIETTIGNNNPLLWNNVTPQSVLEWMRNLVANQLARHGEEWAATFKRFNSGTYNNQWMIVDYNKFTPGEKPKDGLLHVLEQLPGMCVHKDVTHILVENSYWASYNSPYFQEIFNASGLPALVAKYGNWFSHDKTPRALIFARDHSKVTDMNTMVKLMRYNDYQHDPLSACNCTPPYSAENAISARNDLMPADGSYPIPALGHRNHGATDVKVTTSEMRK